MTADLQPYPEYKDSGLPWLGRVPAHWGLRRAKYLYREVDERSQTGEEELCSVSHKTGVTPRKENVTMFMAESTVGYKICRPNDLAINTLWAWMAALGIARQVGVVSPAYGVYRPHPGSELLPDFADRLLRIEEYKAEYIARSTGVNASRLRLYPDQFLRIPLLLPSQSEQEEIARYLEGLDRSVRRFIRNRRQMIEVLNEQKQAIINRAVTHGLDPNAPRKPSGVEWIGDIPAHWDVLPLKRVAWFKSGSGFPVTSQGQSNLEIPFFRVSDMTIPGNDVFMKHETSSVTREEAARLGATVFPKGAIVFPKVGGALLTNKRRILTRPSCVDNNVMGCVASNETADFVFLLLRLIDLGKVCKPGPVPAIGEGDVREIRVPWPPKPEQDRIVLYEEHECSRLNAAIAHAQREIDLIREYRTRLIADVVTGKVDVRGLAPTEPLQEEPLADVDIDDDPQEDTDPEPGEEAANDVD